MAVLRTLLLISAVAILVHADIDTNSRGIHQGRNAVTKSSAVKTPNLENFHLWSLFTEKWKGLRTQYCGGSIVSKNYILTAANCGYHNAGKHKGEKLKESDVFIVAGDYDVTKEDKHEQKIKVSKFVFAKGWDNVTRANDLMLMKLESDIKFKTNIGEVKWNDNAKPKPADLGHVMGWGTIQQQQDGEHKRADKLRVIDYVKVESGKCNDTSANAFCAARQGLIYGNGNMCDGDEGGPYMCGLRGSGKPIICGVASRSVNPKDCRLTAIYTDVSAFDDWIEEQLKA